MSKKATDQCPVCYDVFTGTVRKPVKCPYCDLNACTVCCKRYLCDGTLDAHCMGCRRGWSDDFVDANFSRAWRTGIYRKHREAILFEREMAILPTRQPRAEAYRLREETSVRLSKISEEIAELERKRGEIDRRYSRESAKYEVYNSEFQGRPAPEWAVIHSGIENRNVKKSAERAQFIMRCPADECRGFLSTSYKCGTCSMWACPDCLVIKGANKDDPHTCDETLKETVALIVRESKPCPKCGERISKIDGCFAADTPILMWDGSVMMSQGIQIGDELCGDDGTLRIVKEVCRGMDDMYEIKQKGRLSYTVNSKHTLCLHYKDKNRIQYDEEKNVYGLVWTDPHTKKTHVTESTVLDDIKESDALLQIIQGEDPVIEITVTDYRNLPDYVKGGLVGFRAGDSAYGGVEIEVERVGRGTYYGWSVTENKRFLLEDRTVVRNCDQMWCIECHTAFSWTSGKVINGVIHNPHYYDFLRKTGNGAIPRPQGDIPCGGIPYYHTVSAAIRNMPSKYQMEMMTIHRSLAEVNDQRVANYQGQFNQNDNGDLGCKYLLKIISDEDMKRELSKRETKRAKHMAIRAILEMYALTGAEMLQRLVRQGTTKEDAEKILDELIALRDYVNESLQGIGKVKGCSVPQIGEKSSPNIQTRWRWVPHYKVPKTKRNIKKGGEKEDDSDDSSVELMDEKGGDVHTISEGAVNTMKRLDT